MRVSKTQRKIMRENQQVIPLTKSEKEAARKKRKRLSRLKLVVAKPIL